VIRRSFRLVARFGLLAAMAVALFKLVQGRRSSSELGRPSDDWAPPPPDVPKPPPEPELVQPVILEEIVAKKAAERDPGPAPPADTAEPVVENASPAKAATTKKAVAKKAAAKQAAPAKKATKKQP
jgi:hypothetical protein